MPAFAGMTCEKMTDTRWLSVLFLLLVLTPIAIGAWRRSKSDFLKYGLAWLVILGIIALLYQAFHGAVGHQAVPGSLQGAEAGQKVELLPDPLSAHPSRG